MCFDDVLEMEKPDTHSQYRLVPCRCGSEEVVYLHCRDIFGNLHWKVRCMDCGAEAVAAYAVKHDAQVEWNTGRNILYPGAGGEE